jgi:hypothetical protein
MVHRLIGGMVVLGWLWVVCHLGQWAPGLALAASSGIGRSGRGAIYVLGMPLLGAALLIFPGLFADRFSPSSRMTGEPVLGIGFWRICGYFALLVSWGLLQLFR